MTPTADITLIYLDPNDLVDQPGNIRNAVGDLAELTASIKAVGVLEPLIVVPTDNGNHLIAGARRAAAAVAAGLSAVPCWARPDLAGVTTQTAAQLVENEHRLPLSAAERVRAYHQLAIAGLSPARIAKATGTKPTNVKKALTVGGSDIATATTERYNLTLEQALVLAEFDHDTDAIKLLVAAAKTNPGQWDHVVSRLRTDRAEALARQTTIERLTTAGVRILDDLPPRTLRVLELADSQGQPLDADQHASCPGHAVRLDDYRPDRIVAYCIDPDTHGHTDRWEARRGSGQASTNHTSADGKLTEQGKAQRKRVIDLNRAWRAADTVRLAYVKDLLARKTPPKGTLRYVTQEVLGRPDRLNDGTEATLAALLGVEAPTGHRRSVGPAAATNASEIRLPLVLLAQIAAAYESTMDVHIWRSAHPDAAGWLQFLATTGYTLSAVEQLAVDTATGAQNPSDSQEDLDHADDIDDGSDPDVA